MSPYLYVTSYASQVRISRCLYFSLGKLGSAMPGNNEEDAEDERERGNIEGGQSLG